MVKYFNDNLEEISEVETPQWNPAKRKVVTTADLEKKTFDKSDIDPNPVLDTKMVKKPPHYNQAKLECIDAMEAMAECTDLPPHQAYCWQNAFKYMWRFPYKHKFAAGQLQDLKKCRWYLDRLITKIEGAQ